MIPSRLQLVVAVVVLCAATGLGLSIHQRCFPHCPKAGALLPNPRNCSEYYQCDNALHPHVMPCPIKTVFVPSISKCDWASLHNCTNHPDAPCSTTNAPPSTSHPTTYASTTHNTATTTPTPSTSHPTTATSEEDVDHHRKCHVDCSSGYYLKANPRDCHSYFSCVHGTPVKMPCPEGLQWSESVKRCEWPQIANCEVTCEDEHDETAEESKLPWCDPPVCKQSYGLMANPGNCSTFYNCNDFIPVRQVCPENLEFDAGPNLCTYPKDAHCVQTCQERPAFIP